MLSGSSAVTPYVGLKPYQTDETAYFFGRRREVRDVSSLIVANSVVVLFGASGTGKTSFVNAGLVPQLQAMEFDIANRVRVVGLQNYDKMSTFNPFVRAFCESVAASGGSSHNNPASIADAVSNIPSSKDSLGERQPMVIMIDQAEELFHWRSSNYGGDVRESLTGFLQELAAVTADQPLLRLLIVIREEFLIALDEVAAVFPTHFESRYRLKGLSPELAISVLQNGAKQCGRQFEPGVAQDIVTYVTDDAGAVDLVRLQAVAVNLWERVPVGVQFITQQHVEAIDEAESDYCDLVVANASKLGESARQIFRWIRKHLTTHAGTRVPVKAGADNTAGMPNAVLNELVDGYLLKLEYSHGARWYELRHDALVHFFRK